MSRYPAKVTRPRIARVHPRARLFAHLDDASGRAATWIAAPPGAGKTTLAASYTQARNRPCLWYHVDARDADPATLFHYLALAARKASPRSRIALPALTPEYLPGLPAFTRQYFERLYRRLPAGSIVVFDDYQELPEDSVVHELLVLGLATRPPEVDVIVVSRNEPPPAFARLRANGELAPMDPDALALTRDEAEGIIALRDGDVVAAEQIDHLHERTRGWAAGLVLMLARPVDHEPQDLSERPPQGLFDYFAAEILEELDPGNRKALLKSAVLSRMTPALVSRLCGGSDAGGLLAELTRKNYFTYQYSERPAVYQYHPLFREFLLSRAEAELPAGDLQEVRRQAADLLEEGGHLEEAAELFAAVRAWPDVARVVLRLAQGLLAQGRGQVVDGWIEALPEAVREDHSWLLYWQAAYRLPFDPLTGRDLFAHAYSLFKAKGEMEGAMLAWAGYVDAVEHAQGQVESLGEWIAEGRRTFLPLPEGLPPELEAHFVYGMFSALIMSEPGSDACREWCARAEHWLHRCEDPILRLHIALNLMLARLWKGDYAGGRALNDELQAWLGQAVTPPLARLTAFWVGEQCEWLTGTPAAAMERVEDGLRLGRESGVVFWEPIIIGHGVEAALSSGDFTTAARWLMELKPRLDFAHRPWDYGQYHHLACTVALNRGDAATARVHAQRFFDVSRTNALVHLQVLSRLDLVEATRAGGELDLAERQLREAWPLVAKTGSDLLTFMAHLTEAHLALDRGWEDEALEALRRGLALGRKRHLTNWWGFRAPPTLRLCLVAMENGIEVPYVQALIGERGLMPDEPPVHLPDWPWPVRIRTLGPFAVERDGEPLPFTRKAQKRPLELLKALIALGGRGVPLIDLEDALWPAAKGFTARSTLDTTVHRLRKLLGRPEALIQSGGSLSLDPRHCWLDTWACEPLLAQVEFAVAGLSEEEAGGITEQLLTLCAGPFLPGDRDALWAFAPRERLHARLLQALLALGGRWQAAGAWEMAVCCYRQGIKIDPLDEPCYQRLMICLQNLGRRDEAALTYRQCHAALAENDGREPSMETCALYATLHDER